MPQQQTSSNAILRSWRGLLAARPRMKPGASLPLGVPGRLLREFAQQLVVLGHDLTAIMRAGGCSNAETVSRYLRFSQHNIWKSKS